MQIIKDISLKWPDKPLLKRSAFKTKSVAHKYLRGFNDLSVKFISILGLFFFNRYVEWLNK